MKLLNDTRCRTAGYSLCECMIVCALLLFVTVLALSQISFVQNMLVRSQLYALYDAIQMAQQRAMSTNTKQTIIIDPDNNRYFVDGAVYTLSPYIRFGVVDGAMGPPALPTHPIVDVCTFSDKTISCWPDGIIQAGVVYLVDHNKRYGYALSNAVGSASYVRIYRYEQHEWHIIV